jgi:hypothetical protein
VFFKLIKSLRSDVFFAFKALRNEVFLERIQGIEGRSPGASFAVGGNQRERNVEQRRATKWRHNDVSALRACAKVPVVFTNGRGCLGPLNLFEDAITETIVNYMLALILSLLTKSRTLPKWSVNGHNVTPLDTDAADPSASGPAKPFSYCSSAKIISTISPYKYRCDA